MERWRRGRTGAGRLGIRDVAALARVVTVAVAYLITADLALRVAFVVEHLTPVWPPFGIALAAVLLWGRRVWPGIFAGALGAWLLDGTAPAPALALAASATLQAVVAAWLLLAIGFRADLRRVRDVVAFTAAVVASAGVGATLGVLIRSASSQYPWGDAVTLWWVQWIRDASGGLVVAPFLLAWAARAYPSVTPRRVVEAAALLGGVLLVGWLSFGATANLLMDFPQEYLLFPLMLWAALRFGQAIVASVTALVAVMAVCGTSLGFGHFAMFLPTQGMVYLQVFLWVLAATGLVVGAGTHERALAATQHAARLAEQDRRKDEFLAMLGHELRNPLAPIRTAVEILGPRGGDPETVAWARRILDRQVRRLIRLVDDLLDISRITRAKISLVRAPLDLREIIEDAVEDNRALIEARKEHVEVALPPDPLPLRADAVRLTQVLSNLVNNAAKYTGEGGRIWVRGDRVGDEIIVSVRDEGAGMDPALLARAFDLFEQGDRDRSQGGLGIGLSLARRLVELHGGRVTAQSAGAGRGTEVVVRLPVEEHAAGPSEGQALSPSA